ncbi:MAG: hypothetical protein OXL96_13880 [Candidatus Poribacteria bacterium]|nr:hypothetical protein [Candidatus Poribacteria bacterium]
MSDTKTYTADDLIDDDATDPEGEVTDAATDAEVDGAIFGLFTAAREVKTGKVSQITRDAFKVDDIFAKAGVPDNTEDVVEGRTRVGVDTHSNLLYVSFEGQDFILIGRKDAVIQALIDAAISNEKTARETADTTLQTNIDTEATDRETADTTLQTNIDAEQRIRLQSDDALLTKIDGEIQARADADTALETKIDKVAGRTDVLHFEALPDAADYNNLQLIIVRGKLYQNHNTPAANVISGSIGQVGQAPGVVIRGVRIGEPPYGAQGRWTSNPNRVVQWLLDENGDRLSIAIQRQAYRDAKTTNEADGDTLTLDITVDATTESATVRLVSTDSIFTTQDGTVYLIFTGTITNSFILNTADTGKTFSLKIKRGGTDFITHAAELAHWVDVPFDVHVATHEINSGSAFPPNPNLNNFYLFDVAVTDLKNAVDTDGTTAKTTARKFDLFKFNSRNWQYVGYIGDTLDGVITKLTLGNDGILTVERSEGGNLTVDLNSLLNDAISVFESALPDPSKYNVGYTLLHNHKFYELAAVKVADTLSFKTGLYRGIYGVNAGGDMSYTNGLWLSNPDLEVLRLESDEAGNVKFSIKDDIYRTAKGGNEQDDDQLTLELTVDGQTQSHVVTLNPVGETRTEFPTDGDGYFVFSATVTGDIFIVDENVGTTIDLVVKRNGNVFLSHAVGLKHWIPYPIDSGRNTPIMDTDTHYAFTKINAVSDIPSSRMKGDVIRISTAIASNIPAILRGRDGTTTETALQVGNEYRWDGTNYVKIGDGDSIHGKIGVFDALPDASDYPNEQLIVVKGILYQRFATSTENVFEGTVGGDAQNKGINDGNIGGTNPQGQWTSNPDNFIAWIESDTDGNFLAVVRQNLYRAGKGSHEVNGDELTFDITIDGTTQSATASLGSTPTTAKDGKVYLNFYGTVATDFVLNTADVGDTMNIVVKRNNTVFITHPENLPHWNIYHLTGDHLLLSDTIGVFDDAIPDAGSYNVGQIILHRGQIYKKARTTEADTITGTFDIYADIRGVAPHIGHWTSNPGEEVNWLTVDHPINRLSLAVKRDTYRTKKGSDEADGDQLIVRITNGTITQTATLTIEDETDRTIVTENGTHYLLFWVTVPDNFILMTAAVGSSFSFVVRRGNANFLTHSVGELHWVRYFIDITRDIGENTVASRDVEIVAKITQAAYDALAEKDSNTLYAIVG